MIELQWLIDFPTAQEELHYISQFFEWLLNFICEQYKNDINIAGYIVADSRTEKPSSLIFCDDKTTQETQQNHKKLLEILQQPDEKYKGKYIACILSSEPLPVEKREDEEDDKDEKEKVKEKQNNPP